jgi:hypothetical protein
MGSTLGWLVRASSGRHPRYTHGEDVSLEEQSNAHHEFLDGEISAMAGEDHE